MEIQIYKALHRYRINQIKCDFIELKADGVDGALPIRTNVPFQGIIVTRNTIKDDLLG